VVDSIWIPEKYSMEYCNSIEFPYGMNMETYTKMAGLSAKNIPYGIHGIHMELASIPPGIYLEYGGTVKTSTLDIAKAVFPPIIHWAKQCAFGILYILRPFDNQGKTTACW